MYVCLCVYVSLNHFAIQQKLTQHCKSTILQLKKKKQNKQLPFRKMSPRTRGRFLLPMAKCGSEDNHLVPLPNTNQVVKS